MAETDVPQPPRMPTWVKVFLFVGVAVIITAAAVVVLSGGEHGPGRHLGDHDGPGASATTDAGQPSTSVVSEQGPPPPARRNS